MAEDPGVFVKFEFNTIELPPSVEIRESSVISGQAGAFAKTVIPKDTKFGPFKGEIINAGQKNYIDYRYAWEVFEKDSNVLRHTISALDPKSSNWMRHVNCARFYEEQNILSIQEEFSIFYVAMKNIKPGEELLTWFDPKLLKRTKRRLSKMGRKPVGYTIELVPWSDEKKFVPEIIDTKRKRKKKVLSDMISLDENPLVITRTLQSLAKIPCTPKQIAQSSFRAASMNVNVKTSRTIPSASASLLQKAKKGSKPPSQNMITVHQRTENKANEYVTVRRIAETGKQLHEETDKVSCISLDHGPTAEVAQKEAKKVVFSDRDAGKITDKKANISMLLKKNSVKLGRARLQFSTPRQLLHVDSTSVKPVVVKQNEDGSTSVEDHDETYVLSNMELRPECDDKCQCLTSNKYVKSHSSVKDKQDSFVIHFTLLPEHKSLSADNKIIYRCDVCDSAYNHAFSLKRHYLSVHVNHRYLSRDDILSCQIETFHMDMVLHTEHSKTKTDTLLTDSQSLALKAQSAEVAIVNVPCNGQPEMSVDNENNPRQSIMEQSVDNDKENIINGAKEVTATQQLTSVPSLKHLVQKFLGNARGITEADSCVMESCVSSEGNKSMTLSLPCQLESGMDCVISKPNGGISIAGYVSQDFSSNGHTGIEKSDSGTLQVLSAHEVINCEADETTANNSCDQISDIILDLNPSRLRQHDKIHEMNSSSNREVACSKDLLKKSELEIQRNTSEPDRSHVVKTITGDLQECINGDVRQQDVEESKDLCHSHLNKNILENQGELSAATLNEETHTMAVSDCSTETEKTNNMKPVETISAGSVLDMLPVESESVKVQGADSPREMFPHGDTRLHAVDSLILLGHYSTNASSPPTRLSEECPEGMTDVTQVVDAVGLNVSPVIDTARLDYVSSVVDILELNHVAHVIDTTWMDDVAPVVNTPGINVIAPVVETAGLTVSQVVDFAGLDDVTKVVDTAGINDMSPVVETAGLNDVAPFVETVGLNDVVPGVETAGFNDVVPVVDTTGLNDAAPAVDTAGLNLTSVANTAGLNDGAPVVNTAGLNDGAPGVDTAGLNDGAPGVDTAGLNDVAPGIDTAGLNDGALGVDTAGLNDVAPGIDTAGLNNVAPVVDTAGLNDVAPVVDTAGLNDVAPVVDTAGLNDVAPAGDATGLNDVAPVVDTAGFNDGAPGVDTAGLNDVAPAVDATGLNDVAPVVDTAGLNDGAPGVDTAGLNDVAPGIDTAGLNNVAPVIDTAGLSDVAPFGNTRITVDPCGFVLPVINIASCSSSEAVASEPVQNMDISASSITVQGKPEPLGVHSSEYCTVQTIVDSSTTTSTSVIQSPSAQKLIFVTNLVFPVVSPTHKQPQNSTSPVSQGLSPLTTKTSQPTSVPLVVISQVPCSLNMQNATSAFLPSSSALKALQTMKNSFSVLNFGNSPSGLSLSVLPPSSKSSISSSAGDKVLLDSSVPLCMSVPATTATSLGSCSASLSEQTFGKLVKPSLNLCTQFATISSVVLGGAHVQGSSTCGSTKCITSPTIVPMSSISSINSVNNNATLVDGQPDDLYRCHMCVRVFKTLNELKLHIRNDPHRFKGGIKQYACQQCSMRFSNKNNLIRHNLMNHPESENYKFRCYTCGKGFMCETYLKMHARFHSGRNFPCKYGCTDVYFPNAATLVKHLRTQHPGLNLKEYLRNAKACKAHSRKLSCLLRTTVEQNTSLGTEGPTLGTGPSAVFSRLPYSLEQPGVGFQAKRGHSKGSKAVFPHGEDTKMIDQCCEFTPDTEESPSNTEDSCRLRYVCDMCLKRFRSHLKLLQHRTQHHGADESVQEYLYKMSKDTLDENMSDTGSVKLKFSPPPSPTSFFENVNKRGFENVNHYIDGNEESLQFWQKHLNLQENTDPMLISGAVKKLEWTTFNFPPCFEYREDCTMFYDSTTQPGTSPKLLPHPAEDYKEACRAHSGVDTSSGTEGALKQETIEPCSQEGAKSSLIYGDDTCSKNVSNCMDVDEQVLVASSKSQDHIMESQQGLELCKSIGSVTKTDSCETIHDAENITLEQNQQYSFMNFVVEKQEMIERDTFSEESRVEGMAPEDKVSVTFDNSVTNQEVETENHIICRNIVNQLVSRAESTIEEKYDSSRSHSMLDGNSNLKACLCEGARSVSAADAPPDIDVKVEIKQEAEHVQEIISTSSEAFTVADMILHRFTEFSVKDKLDLFKSQCIQGLNLALSEHNHGLFLQKGLMPRDKPVSHWKSQSSQSVLGALDLQIINGWLSSETGHQVASGGCKQALTSMKKKALSLESLVLWPPNKQSDRHFDHALDTSLNNSDTSRHDHRRYSIWTGQVHQKFDNTSKHDMFCQPVTEAVRKQEVMREKAQYNYEKSIRDNELRMKDEKATQKMSFAESLGLMSRSEFDLSHHSRKQQQFIIKVPEVWNNYENIWFGKKGNITVVCSICHRHFSCWDLCLRHQLKKHPHIEPASLEMEKDNYVEDMYYYYPMPYGILAQTHLIPDNLPVPEVYVCIRCGFPFKNLNRLHAHIIVCDPAQEEVCSSQNNGVKKVSYMKKKLLPMMDRRLHQQVEQPKTKISKTKNGVDVMVSSSEAKHSKSLPVNGKTSKPTQHSSDNKLMVSAAHSRTTYPTHFSFYSGNKGKNLELLYNPQNHTRRREMYKILDQHQCHGCNLKFNSLYMLERHVNKCSGKDKLQNQKPLLSGIMPDDAALRKQHTCRYCGKRFTYIKGVDLHYKRICAVRKVKEEENQLTEEDFAHEDELKKILEHIKWSKSLSKDSSDIIQGHVKVEEDGTLTRVVKLSDCSPGQKKKVKKKGCKWTTLKRHRPEDDVDSASLASSNIQTAAGNTSVADEKADKANILDVVGSKRLTRSAGQEGLHQNISNLRQTSTDRDTARKKAKTASKSPLVNSSSKSNSPVSLLTQNKTDGNGYNMKSKSKKLTSNEQIHVSESRQNRTSKSTVRTSRSPGARSKIACSTVLPAACIKPPERKRGKPKRFDPSDMESSYKKKKKDEEIILQQTKHESGGKNRNTTNDTKQKASALSKGNEVGGQSSHVLRPTSSRSSTDASSSASTSKVSVNKNVSTKEDESKMFEKMKKLKEAAKSESRKSGQKKKLSVSIFTNYANKRGDSGYANEKKSDRAVNKVSNSSELFKHLTTGEQILHKNSPQKAVPNRKRNSSMDSADDVKNCQLLAKRVKITSHSSRNKSPALSTASNVTESPDSKFNKTAQKYQNKSEDKYKESDQEPAIARTLSSSSSSARKLSSSSSSSARTLLSSSTNVSPDSKGVLSKPTSPISKQPTVTFKVVTLSPNGSNLLTYDSSADVPQSSLLLTKPGKVASHLSPTQQILKCLPQRPIQFVTKSSGPLHGTELQKISQEPGIKVISAENLGLGVARDKQALSTLLIAEGDNIRIKKPMSQVGNQGFISQKDVLCKVLSSPDGKQGLICHTVRKQENKEVAQSLRDTEQQIRYVSSHSQDRVIVQRVVDKHYIGNQLVDNICEEQIMLNSAESSLIDSAEQIVSKQSQKSSENDNAQLCHADLLFTKPSSSISTEDENLSNGQNQVAVSSVSSVLSLTEPQCQKWQTLTEQTKSEVGQIVQSVSQSQLKSSSIPSGKSSSISALRVVNSLSPTNSHGSVSAIVVPSTTELKVHVTVPHAVSTTTATKFTFPSRFRSPAKVVTVTGTVLPHLSQGNAGHTATRILKLGGVNIKNVPVSPAQPQSIITQHKQIPNNPHVLPQIVTQKPLVLTAGQLPRLLTTGARHQRPNTHQIILPGALRQSMLNIAANQTNCPTQILPGRCISKTVSPQVCIPQSSLVNNIVNVAQPLSISSVGSSNPVSSVRSQKTSNISLVAAPASNQIMFSLDDGTTAMLDPDSLAQFLTVSPSLNKSELYSTAPATAVQEYKSPLVLNITGNQPNPNVEEINWPANGTVDLTDVSDTMID